MDGKIDVNITFDDNNQIRVLSADKYRETENLKGECIDFLKKIMNFNDMVSTLIDLLDAQAQKIEDAKLKAVGARNKIEGEEDNRRKRELTYQYDSLQKVANEQKLTIEKLSNNES
ncbi:intraflagellar transport protein 20 [Stylonychia lemnae]|uniref:Intraflagellar transport protein 20 n=1 Tax=Stylonychia lemnae TaxID=5949 RepID=A0A078AMB2_STYLE|nr:intraflagellar transport protein 20 [Stylonychia lemnae]|eukprot:CDW81988.1 intraflagellar transport protein 20 [Stylonychia lemnae]